MDKTTPKVDQVLSNIRNTLDLNLIEYLILPNWKPLSDHGTVYEYGIILRDHDRESLQDIFGIEPGSLAPGYAQANTTPSFAQWDWYTSGSIVVFNTWSENE